MSAIKVCIGGELFDEHQAVVPVFDRGFLYGDSVFEVTRTYNRVPYKLTEHLARMRRSADRLLISVPWGDAVFREEVDATFEASGYDDAYIRIIVTRGGGPISYDPSSAINPLRVIIAAPLPLPPPEAYTEGVEVIQLRASRPTEDKRAAGVKASNYLSNLLAMHEAKQKGGYEAILLGPNGQVLEGATSNVFVVNEGRVRTPRLETGILAGITRATVMQAAREAGIEMTEIVLFPRDLYDADEVFITSSIREVVPVVRADGRVIGEGRPGPVTKRLHEAFRLTVGAASD